MSAAQGKDTEQRGAAARAALAVGLFALVAAASVCDVVCVARDGAVPSAGDWRRGRELVESEAAANDIFVAAPEWLDPVMRWRLGARISPTSAARMDGERFGDLWLLSARGATHPETSGRREDGRWRFGALEVVRYRHRARSVVFDTNSALPQARVSGRWRSRPLATIEEVDFRPRACVRGEPTRGAHPAVVYSAVELGDELVGHVGLADIFTLRELRGPASVSVTIDGDEVARLRVSASQRWARFVINTRGLGPVDLGFHAYTEEKSRIICFVAEGRR